MVVTSVGFFTLIAFVRNTLSGNAVGFASFVCPFVIVVC